MTAYVTNEEYRRQKSALTRAINSGDPLKVLTTVERTLNAWEDKAWPDAWSRWRTALDDAWRAFSRAHTTADWIDCQDTVARFSRASARFDW